MYEVASDPYSVLACFKVFISVHVASGHQNMGLTTFYHKIGILFHHPF
jgi:hypothetical protein